MASEEVLYAKGAKIWIPDSNEVWVGAVLEQNYKKGDTGIKSITENGDIVDCSVNATGSNLPPLRNPAILIGQNDLTALSYLHEPGVLFNLRVRFCERQTIYTYCGIILVAINPYADLPLYGSSIIRAYRGRAIGELEPHIFALAEEAYTKLEREKCNLSIIVSGESGAGKTVSAKYAMRYFAAVGGSESETQVERKVLASSPIMEAFGNAKTTRNDNSSRFGKFTKLLFKNNMGVMHLTGGSMQTYLLEKSRVVFQALGERNYHIFYQLCSSREHYPELILDHQSQFEYLHMGGSPDIDRVSDKEQFLETLQAMTVLGFSLHQISDILKILSGILHLGNINFINKVKKDSEEIDPDGCDIFHNDKHLRVCGEILKINSDELRKWLISRQIESVNEYVLIPKTIYAAQAAKDALAKHIYAKLFQYIVCVINKSLNIARKQSCFIGVLDIYGFETFEINSFEQFCINYANEKLQQQFNQHVFKLEQEEYLKEGITWTMIDFYDNQPCINLIESKLGVFDLLDEECKMPKGSDDSWAVKLIEKCSGCPEFEKARFGSSSFLIKHFCDTVEYNIYGFLEKNRDSVSKELVNVIRRSELPLCKQLIDLEEIDTLGAETSKHDIDGRIVISPGRPKTSSSKKHRRSVGSQFRESLASLIKTLHATTPHYVRCIKPNDDKIAFKWESAKIVQQLRACGILETVRISAAGFPSRWSYADFYIRYQLLINRALVNKSDLRQTCENILTKWITDEDKYRLGNSQIFFRAGQVAFLEQLRANLRKRYITIIQSVVRRFVCRRRFQRLRRIALGIQRYSRGFLARQKAQRMREERAALVIHKYAKGWLCRRRFNRLRYSICGIQQYARGLLARQRFHEALDHRRAIQIQRFMRGFLVRRAYQKRRKDIIICQAAVRRFLARRAFKRMKVEAKTIFHIQKMYKGLENKIISLQQKIDELNRENSTLKHKTSEISILKMKLDVKKTLENEMKGLKAALLEKEHTLDTMSKQIDAERDEKMLLLEEKDTTETKWLLQRRTWAVEHDELRKQMDDMIEMARNAESTALVRYKQKITEGDTLEIHEAYQRALKDKETIENENFHLKDELSKFYKPDATFHHDNMEKSVIVAEALANTGQTSLLLKLRNILEEEKKKNKFLSDQFEKVAKRNKSTEDSLRVSELEVENEKLRSDYELLRNSIERGVEMQELDAQYNALREELKRRRDECIQLKAVLQEHSQSLKTFDFGSKALANAADSKNAYDSALVEALQTQKTINRQLESELSSLTEDNNAHLTELSRQIDDLRKEKAHLEELLQADLDELDESSMEALRQRERYLRYELLKSMQQYSQLQEEMNLMRRKFELLKHGNSKLELKLEKRETIDKNSPPDDNSNNLGHINKQKSSSYQGVMKFMSEDLDKILQRLVTNFSTRVAISLSPGFPAFVIFMCIRYTDLINAEDDVRELLSKFVIQLKKIHRNPSEPEMRALWLVNSITLYNLLKQYGDVEEYVKYNTEKQNQQQLKNFNLYEYRRVILEIIIIIYQALIIQMENAIEPCIVPAILDNDEIQRGRQAHGLRSRITSPEPTSAKTVKIAASKQLINQLDHFYKQLQTLGLDSCYSEQVFQQLMYFICAVAMNCLMLRGDSCNWETGMIIRYNLGNIEDWVRGKKMSNDVLATLAPLNQVSQLLQSRKSDQDVQSICDLCSSLNTAQVLKVMKSYKVDDYEDEITNAFLEKLTDKLNERSIVKNEEFTIDQKFIGPFKVVYKYSEVNLENIELPKHMNLDDILTKI